MWTDAYKGLFVALLELVQVDWNGINLPQDQKPLTLTFAFPVCAALFF